MLLTHLQLGRRGPDGSALVDGPLVVGWTRSGIIGFGGFDDYADAHAAATAAAAVLRQWSANRAADAPAEFPGQLSSDEAVFVDGRAVARVLKPKAVKTDVPGYGFEVAVPHAMWLAVMLELAQRIHATLVGSRRALETGGVGA
ncbi:MAG TPA: hypothetical protein VFM71_07970 [Gemmatimonadaceae bacterium]|nr:hypothetical protein [Gemmatimonadaceae bacterium]